MKTSRTIIAALPLLGSLGFGLGLAAPASAATTPNTTMAGPQAQGMQPHGTQAQGTQAQGTGAQTPQALRPVVLTCGKEKVTRPRAFWLSCGDSSFVLVNLTWNSWKLDRATGSGVAAENDCTPSCANGKWRAYPVNVAFKGRVRVYGYPRERRYTSYTLTYTGARPPWQKTSTYTGSLWP